MKQLSVQPAVGPSVASVQRTGLRGAHMSWMEIGEMWRLHVLLSCCVYCQEQKWAPLLSAFNLRLDLKKLYLKAITGMGIKEGGVV